MATRTTTMQNAFKLIVHYTTSDYAEVFIAHAENLDEAKKRAEALWKKENPNTQIIAVELP